MVSDEVGVTFVRLGLAIGRHLPGYVDTYFGPADIAQKVEAEYGVVRTKAGIASAWQPFEFRAYRIEAGMRAAGRTVEDAEELVPGARLFVHRLRRGGEIIEAQPDTRFDRAHFKSYGASSLDFEVVFYVLQADYVRAWDLLVEGGWPSMECDPDFGGQGVPSVLNMAVGTMQSAANMAFIKAVEPCWSKALMSAPACIAACTS